MTAEGDKTERSGSMKLKISRPMPSIMQRRDIGKWLANGGIAVHNDREHVSVDVIVHGGEADTKEEATRKFFDTANRDFVLNWLNSGGAEQLHR
jgi:hypothetical protein